VSEAEIDREGRYRLAIMGASVPLLGLAAPVLLPFFDDRSLLEQSHWDSAQLLVVASRLRSLARARPSRAGNDRFRRARGDWPFAAAGLSLLMVKVLVEHSRAREEPGTWVALLASATMIYVLGRGVRRSGWERWAQLVAGTWLLYVTFTSLFTADRRGSFDPLTSGAWLFLFALSAAAPAIAWILWPKRRSEAWANVGSS
jgi:hypothetical protein